MKLSTKTLIGLGIAGALTITVKAVKSAKTLIENELDVRNSLFDSLPEEGLTNNACAACKLEDDCHCECKGNATPHLIATGDTFQLVEVDCECGLNEADCTSFELIAVDTTSGLKETLKELRTDGLFEYGVLDPNEYGDNVMITPIENSDLVEFSAGSLSDIQGALQARLENNILAEPVKPKSSTPSFIPHKSPAFLTVSNDPESIFNALSELHKSGVIPRKIILTKADLKRLHDDLDDRCGELLECDVIKVHGTVPEIHEKMVYILNVLYRLGEVDTNGDLKFDIVDTGIMIENVNAILREFGTDLNKVPTIQPKDKENTTSDGCGFNECFDIDGKPYEPVEDSEEEIELTDAELKDAIEKIYLKLNPHLKKAQKGFKKVTENNKDLLDKAKKPVRHLFDEFNNIGK